MAFIELKFFADRSDIRKLLSHQKFIIEQLLEIKNTMATFQEIRTEFDNLKTAIAEERQQILDKIQELEDTINSGDGGSVEDRAALLEELKGQVAAVKEIIPDPTDVPETPEEEPGEGPVPA